MIKVKLVFFLFSREFWQAVITIFHYLVQLFRLALSESNKALTVCLSRPHGETFFTIASTRRILPWSQGYNIASASTIWPYNPLISFRAILLAILGHVVPNRRAGTRQYTPSESRADYQLLSESIVTLRYTTVQDGKAELYLLQLIKDRLQVSIRHLGTRRELEPKGVPQLFVGLLLRARWSAIGHFFPVSLETVPEVFAKINWAQFPRCL